MGKLGILVSSIGAFPPQQGRDNESLFPPKVDTLELPRHVEHRASGGPSRVGFLHTPPCSKYICPRRSPRWTLVVAQHMLCGYGARANRISLVILQPTTLPHMQSSGMCGCLDKSGCRCRRRFRLPMAAIAMRLRPCIVRCHITILVAGDAPAQL